MLLCLAPMDGRTDAAYRHLLSETYLTLNPSTLGGYRGPAERDLLLRTEFMTADGYWHNPAKVISHITHYKKPLSEGEGQGVRFVGTIAQIFGGNHDTLLQAAIDLEHNYPHLAGIELNIGCPAPTVFKCDAGAAMMKDKQKTLEIVRKIAFSIKKPFSIKTRTGLSDADRDEQRQFIIDASNVCSMITVHGRTYKQAHTGPVDWERIYTLKTLINPTCKLIGNGGITDYEHALAMCGNLDGVMLGTATMGNPRVFTGHTPTLAEKYQTIRRHLDLMMAYELWHQGIINNEKGIMSDESGVRRKFFSQPTNNDIETIIKTLQLSNHQANNETIKPCNYQTMKLCNYVTPITFRKHLFCYLKGIPDAKVLKQEACQCETYEGLVAALERFFGPLVL